MIVNRKKTPTFAADLVGVEALIYNICVETNTEEVA